jgi:hypothetical protein
MPLVHRLVPFQKRIDHLRAAGSNLGKDLRQRLVKLSVVKFPSKLDESHGYVPLFVLG